MQPTRIIKKFYSDTFFKFVVMQCIGKDHNETTNPAEREQGSVRKEEEHLWRKCNKLFKSDKTLTKFCVTSLLIHCAVLVFVTLSTVTLAKEKYHFRESWVDMQKGYFSLLLKNYSDPVKLRHLKYVYTSQVKILSSQEEVIDHLKYAYQRFDMVSNISLAEVTKSTDPTLCIAKQMPVDLTEVYSRKLIKECKTVTDEEQVTEVLSSNLNSMSLISMEFQLKQLYLIEGYKPICINIDASYSVENGDQEYLWPVRIFVKGRLTTCDETLGKINYLPIRNLHKLIIIGILNGVTCVFGFILHCFKLLTFISIGKKVRGYATKKHLSKPLWSYLPKNIQLCLWQKSTEDIEQYANMYQFIPLRAYVIFCPPVHILDMIFLLLSIIGVILEFTLLRRATSTDEMIHYSTIVSFVLGLSALYFWTTSYRLFNFSKSAGVTIKSVINSRATKATLLALMVAGFAYIGVTLLAWVLLGLFHPYFSTFRSSAESFWALLFGDEILDVSDYILPEHHDHKQYLVFLVSRMIIAFYGLLFPFIILSIIMAIITVAAEEKWMRAVKVWRGTYEQSTTKFTWKVILKWVTASAYTPFPGAQADEGNDSDDGSIHSHHVLSIPEVLVTTFDSSKPRELLPSEDVVDLRLETTNSVSDIVSTTEGHGLCTETLNNRNCQHQSQSSSPQAGNCSGKSYHNNYYINLRSSANNLYLFKESEV